MDEVEVNFVEQHTRAFKKVRSLKELVDQKEVQRANGFKRTRSPEKIFVLRWIR